MINTEQVDAFTLKHMTTWLENAVINPDALAPIRDAMLAEYVTDPEYWDRAGWTPLYDAIDGYKYERWIESA